MSDNETFFQRMTLLNLAATAAAVTYMNNPLDVPIEVEAISFVPFAALTADAANNRSFAALNGSDALFTAVPTTVGGSGSLVAGTPRPFTLLETQTAKSARRIPVGGNLTLSATHAASGVAISGEFVVKFRRVR